MHFYSSSRHDGLVKHIEQDHKVIEYFSQRDDGLVYRSVAFDPHDTVGLMELRDCPKLLTHHLDF